MRLACALTALVLLAGCSGHRHDPTPPPLPTDSVSAPPTQDTASPITTPPTAPPSDVIAFPTPQPPDADTRAAYLADLDLADSDIVHGDPDLAVARGIAQCATFHQFPDDLDHQIGIAHERFTSPNHPLGFPIGDTKYIVQTVHKHLCPDYPYPSETPIPDDTGDRPAH